MFETTGMFILNHVLILLIYRHPSFNLTLIKDKIYITIIKT